MGKIIGTTLGVVVGMALLGELAFSVGVGLLIGVPNAFFTFAGFMLIDLLLLFLVGKAGSKNER